MQTAVFRWQHEQKNNLMARQRHRVWRASMVLFRWLVMGYHSPHLRLGVLTVYNSLQPTHVRHHHGRLGRKIDTHPLTCRILKLEYNRNIFLNSLRYIVVLRRCSIVLSISIAMSLNQACIRTTPLSLASSCRSDTSFRYWPGTNSLGTPKTRGSEGQLFPLVRALLPTV